MTPAAKKAADRMAKWIDRLCEEWCADGIREATMQRADTARAAYEEARRKHEQA